MAVDSSGFRDDPASGQVLRIAAIVLTLAAPLIAPVIIRMIVKAVVARISR